MTRFETIDPMPPSTPKQIERGKLYARYKEDERYLKAKSCQHCTNIADSFNRYISTYCHIRQENIAGFVPDLLDRCMTCKLYKKRSKKK